jgi:hypothetical protein
VLPAIFSPRQEYPVKAFVAGVPQAASLPLSTQF